ncbi:MAG TPA: 50S ribosomal protein L29 [Nanoarchaeota archaeon]|nr:50S ribosomal protein L29 [Nanoarchaeota archaeon]
MAIIRKKEIKKMSEEELKKKLNEFRLELMKLNAQRVVGAVTNPGRIRELRRCIARILTELNLRKGR